MFTLAIDLFSLVFLVFCAILKVEALSCPEYFEYVLEINARQHEGITNRRDRELDTIPYGAGHPPYTSVDTIQVSNLLLFCSLAIP